MSPVPACLAGYPIKVDVLEQYRKQHGLDGYNLRPFVQHLESKVGIPIALARVDNNEVEDTSYICCFVDYSGRTYSADELSLTPIPASFERLPELFPGAIAGDLKKLFVSRAMLFSYDSAGKSRIDEHGAPIGGFETDPEQLFRCSSSIPSINNTSNVSTLPIGLAWYEWFPTSTQNITSTALSFTAGDIVVLTVTSTSTTMVQLVDFGNVTFSGARAGTVGGEVVGLEGAVVIDMIDGDGDVVAKAEVDEDAGEVRVVYQ